MDINQTKQKGRLPMYHLQSVLPKLQQPEARDSFKVYLDLQRKILQNDTRFKEIENNVNNLLQQNSEMSENKEFHPTSKYEDSLVEYTEYTYLSRRRALSAGQEIHCFTEPINLQQADNEISNLVVGMVNILWSTLDILQWIKNEKLEPFFFDKRRFDPLERQRIIDNLTGLPPLDAYTLASSKGLYPLCMEQFKYVSNVARLPGDDVDTIHYKKNSRHIVVFKSGYAYRLEVLSDEGMLIDPRQLYLALLEIDEDQRTSPRLPVSHVTHLTRPQCNRLRHFLVANDDDNASNLSEIDDAIFVFSMDEKPENIQLRSVQDSRKFNMQGHIHNRWSEKTNISVDKDGHGCFSSDHSKVDGYQFLVIVGLIMERVKRNPCLTSTEGVTTMAKMYTLNKLDFNYSLLFEYSLNQHIGNIRATLSEIDMTIVLIKMGILRSDFNVNFLVQLICGLACYRTTGEFRLLYESISTQHFSKGRVHHSCGTLLSNDECKEFDDLIKDVKSSNELSTLTLKTSLNLIAKLKLLQNTYKQTILNAKKGLSAVDHLLYLEHSYRTSPPSTRGVEQTKSKVFEDSVFSSLRRNKIYLSYLPRITGVEDTCFGPYTADSWYISYSKRRHNVYKFTIIAYKQCGETNLFADNLEKVSEELLGFLNKKEFMLSNTSPKL